MVGHPGETEADFEELKEFVRKVRFDRMGAFAYSEEEGTFAANNYEDNISQGMWSCEFTDFKPAAFYLPKSLSPSAHRLHLIYSCCRSR